MYLRLGIVKTTTRKLWKNKGNKSFNKNLMSLAKGCEKGQLDKTKKYIYIYKIISQLQSSTAEKQNEKKKQQWSPLNSRQ